MVGRSTRSLDSARMSETHRASEIAVFAIAMMIAVFLGTWYSIYGLGHSEGAIGNELDNLKVSALFFLPIVALSSAGYWLGSLPFRNAPPRAGIISSAIASSMLMFAWPLIVPYIPTAMNLVGFGVYCLILGALSRIVISAGIASRGAV
jgi:hypothetical protein